MYAREHYPKFEFAKCKMQRHSIRFRVRQLCYPCASVLEYLLSDDNSFSFAINNLACKVEVLHGNKLGCGGGCRNRLYHILVIPAGGEGR